MSKFARTNLLQSFSCALRGIILAVKSQKNIKRHIVSAIITVISALLLKFNVIEFSIILIMISLVICAEIFNSVIEFMVDAIYKNKYSQLAKMAKDMAAGGVFTIALFALIIGLLLFGNKIICLLS